MIETSNVVLSVALLVSVLVNLGLMYGGYRLFTRSLAYAKAIDTVEFGVEEVIGSLSGFREHLFQMQQNEVFNSDPIFAELVAHSKVVIETVEVFRDNMVSDANE